MDVGIGTFTSKGFDEAVEATRAALDGRGFGILHEIDLTATLKNSLDKDIEKVLILGACRPDFAADGYAISKDIALLLPCNVVVRETSQGCVIEAMNPEMLTVQVSGGLQPLVAELSATMREMMRELAD